MEEFKAIRAEAGLSSAQVYVDYMLFDYNKNIIGAMVYASSGTVVDSFASSFRGSVRVSVKEDSGIEQSFYSRKDGYVAKKEKNNYEHDYFFTSAILSKVINKDILITSNKTLNEDLYNFLMSNFPLPLLTEWMPYLFEQLLNNDYCEYGASSIYADENRLINLNGNSIPVSEILVLDMSNLSIEGLKWIVPNGLQNKKISICNEYVAPLEYNSFNDYVSKYGHSLIENMDKEIVPLVPLVSKIDALALKSKRLFPQQAACVAGIIALKREKSKYGLMIEGMGTGKTVQGMSVVEAYFVEEYMRKHPGVSLKDVYMDPSCINYRVILVAPGHLVSKWKNDIERDIPYAKVTVLASKSKKAGNRQGKNGNDEDEDNGLKVLMYLKKAGKARNGREFFLMSKDFAKAGDYQAPIPYQVKKKEIPLYYCTDCYEGTGDFKYKEKDIKQGCTTCGGHNFTKKYSRHAGTHKGLICPHCGELLVKWSRKLTHDLTEDQASELVLVPYDFKSHNDTNSVCTHCGGQLWGTDTRKVNCGGTFEKLASRPSKWSKYKHFKNHSKKGTVNSFFRTGHLNEFLVNIDEKLRIGEAAYKAGPRRYAPAKFIKKYLKGYFDFAILDECHKFEGAGTAQSNAAHAIIQASDFSLGLTGTITNGTASSLFYLLYMLDSERMKKYGYGYGDVLEFSKKYGSVETEYEHNSNSNSTSYNVSSRGRQLTQPKVKPGISPLLYADFLMDKSVMLDISDMSKFLPVFKEEVITVPLNEDISSGYNEIMRELKASLRTKEGAGLMSEVLNVGLSYPDKPYGRGPIMSTRYADEVVVDMVNYEEYAESDCLLNKEERFVDEVKKEVSEGRNMVIFVEYSGKSETNITYRLKWLLEEYCGLRGSVEIMNPSSPSASQREEWIHKRASEGIKVFICNPKLIETGLDLCFEYEGKIYNFPTLMFFQTGYALSVIWQASRRAYRLNQREECRNYYFAYSGTLQTLALEIMALKMSASSAIQGRFSSEGLASMAKGVDTRVKLAQALAEGHIADDKSIENMFDVVNQINNSDDESYSDYVPPITFGELTGVLDVYECEQSNIIDAMDMLGLFDNAESDSSNLIMDMAISEYTEEHNTVVVEQDELNNFGFDFDMFDFDKVFEGMIESTPATNETKILAPTTDTVDTKKRKKKKNKVNDTSQITFEFGEIA